MRTHSENLKRRASQARTGWSASETAALLALYDVMLALQDAGALGAGGTTKAALVRSFIAEHAPHRSKGSVESKLMNASACRVEMGLPIVDGYKALPNMASACREMAESHWGQS